MKEERQILVRISPELHDRLQAAREVLDLSQAQIIRRAITAYLDARLDQHPKGNPK